MHGHKTLAAVLVVVLVGTVAVGPAAGQQSTDAQRLTIDSHAECGFPLEVTDATGETVTVEEEPTEVVVLYPNVAQHLWEIGAKEKVIGMPVNDATGYLEGSDQRTDIQRTGEQGLRVPDTETIVDLEPDLVLAPNVTPRDAITQLRDAGETVYHYPVAGGFDDVMAQVERTGQLVGACDGAQNVTAEMAATIAFVENATAGVDEPRAFYDLGGGFTANADAFEHEVITRAGMENIAADVESEFGSAYPQISAETVVARDPQVIIKTNDAALSNIDGYNATTALRNDQVIEVNANLISQHAPRTVDVLKALAEELHPEALREARQAEDEGDGDTGDDNETIEENETTDDDIVEENETTDGDIDTGNGTANDSDDVPVITENRSDDENATNDTNDADGSGPGLTVVAPALALVALALLARRRTGT